jgi:hypothetical protein
LIFIWKSAVALFQDSGIYNRILEFWNTVYWDSFRYWPLLTSWYTWKHVLSGRIVDWGCHEILTYFERLTQWTHRWLRVPRNLDAFGNTHSVDASLIEGATKSRHTRKYAYRIWIAPITSESKNSSDNSRIWIAPIIPEFQNLGIGPRLEKEDQECHDLMNFLVNLRKLLESAEI